MFIKPGDEVYEGQVVGEFNKDEDITVNVCREKKLTNMRTTSSDDNIILKPPPGYVAGNCGMEYIEDDELVEITPETIRLRKRYLKENERKRHSRAAEAALADEKA